MVSADDGVFRTSLCTRDWVISPVTSCLGCLTPSLITPVESDIPSPAAMSAEDGMMSPVELSRGSGVPSIVVNPASMRQDTVHGWLSPAQLCLLYLGDTKAGWTLDD